MIDFNSFTSTDEFRKKLSVDTSRFLLFLYVQNTPRLSLKSSFTTSDEWPSPETEKRHRFPENAHLAFMKTHISEILDLLADTGRFPLTFLLYQLVITPWSHQIIHFA